MLGKKLSITLIVVKKSTRYSAGTNSTFKISNDFVLLKNKWMNLSFLFSYFSAGSF